MTFRQNIKSFHNVLHWMKLNTILNCFRIKKKALNILDLLYEDFISVVVFHRYMVGILPMPLETQNNPSTISVHSFEKSKIWSFLLCMQDRNIQCHWNILKENKPYYQYKYMYKHPHSTEPHSYPSTNYNTGYCGLKFS